MDHDRRQPLWLGSDLSERHPFGYEVVAGDLQGRNRGEQREGNENFQTQGQGWEKSGDHKASKEGCHKEDHEKSGQTKGQKDRDETTHNAQTSEETLKVEI